MICFNKYLDKKFFNTCGGFLIVLIIALAILFGVVSYFGVDDFNRDSQVAQEMEDKYKNDTYGGATPDETLQLFISALKAGDTELASKYFVIDKQANMKNDLEIGKKNGTLASFIGYLEKPKIDKQKNDNIHIFTFSENNTALMTMDLILNPISNKWKIESI